MSSLFCHLPDSAHRVTKDVALPRFHQGGQRLTLKVTLDPTGLSVTSEGINISKVSRLPLFGINLLSRILLPQKMNEAVARLGDPSVYLLLFTDGAMQAATEDFSSPG